MRFKRLLNAGVLAGWRWLDRAGEIVPGTRAADGFGSFGADACIGFPAGTLMGTRSIHIGTGTLVGRHATLAVGYGPGDPNLPERGLVVGDRCVLGARVTVLAHTSVVIEDDVWFGQDVFVSDSGHGYQDPSRPIGEQFGGHQPVRIGTGSWLGHGAIVLPGADIGRNVVVAAGSVVRGPVPDHSVVGGAPARVIRRFEPGVGWVGTRGDVRPVVVGTWGEVLDEALGQEPA
ncbi:acyltransferase [Nocardioides sp.]|uniref:acyltransferase n=1 Tax=Nocardioides sp. TaxID=35761 RepID=UPI003783D471